MPAHAPLSWYLILSAVLFTLGAAGFLFRRNLVTVFMSIELMLNAVNLSFVAFAYHWKQVDGQVFTFFVMVVAAAEAAVGRALFTTYLLPFEVTSLLILIAILGAIVLARKEID